MAAQVGAIQLVQEAELVVTRLGRDARRRLQVEDRRLPRAERRPLVDRRQPAARPVAHAVDRQAAGIGQDHVGRQVLVLGAQGVDDPRAPGRPAGQDLAGVDQPQRCLVIDRLGRHRADQREIVDDPGGMRQELAQHHSRLSLRLKRNGEASSLPACVLKWISSWPG